MSEPSAALRFDPGSFRDPSGRVFLAGHRVFRRLTPDGWGAFERLASTDLYQRLQASGRVIDTTPVDATAAGLDPTVVGERILEHRRVPFVTYPYEWSFDMLRDAALLTLDLLDACLEAGFVIKDATPYNVQFVDGRPVWIDVLSLEPRTDDAPWVGYSQFCMTQLFPLMLTAYRSVEFQPWLRASLTGVPGGSLARLLRLRDHVRGGVLTHVVLPAHFDRFFGRRPQLVSKARRELKVPVRALRSLAARLRRTVAGLRYRDAGSTWADYTDTRTYGDADVARKTTFVDEACATWAGGTVWDLGTNTGEFAAVAARHARHVVAFDIDPAAINRLYLRQKAGRLPAAIQPVVGDLTNPSPGLGWGLTERQPWRDRGRPDGFLALALVHHLRITGGIPTTAIVDALAETAPRGVVEFVDRPDAMVRTLLANREDVFGDYTAEAFEAALRTRFRIRRRLTILDDTRTLYEVERHDA